MLKLIQNLGGAFALQVPNGLIVLLLPVFATTTIANAQSPTVQQLHSSLQTAVCRNDWQQALQAINRLIGSEQITPASRAQLVQFRAQLQEWQATSARVTNIAGCEAVALQSPTSPAPPGQSATPSPPVGARPTPSEPQSLETIVRQRWRDHITHLKTCTPHRIQITIPSGQWTLTSIYTIAGWQGDRCPVTNEVNGVAEGELAPRSPGFRSVCRYTQANINILTTSRSYVEQAARLDGVRVVRASDPEFVVQNRACGIQ